MDFRHPLLFLGLFVGLSLSAGHEAPAAVPDPGQPEEPSGVMPATAGHVGQVLAELREETGKVQRRLDALAVEATQVRALSIARGRTYVRLARAGLLPVGGGFEALVGHAARLERLRRALGRDIKREEAIARERLGLANRLRLLGERRALLEDERAALERSHAAIEAAEEREHAFQKAFLGGAATPNHTAVYASGRVDLEAGDYRGGFARMRGRLPFPLAGRAEIQLDRTGTESGALRMSARAGATVTAVYPGRVAFADEYADRGKTVILEHGDDYYTVSAGLGALAVGVGDPVEAGARLGELGAASPSLYFEIRRGAEGLDAEPWLGL